MPFLGKVPSQIVDPEVDIDGGTIDGVAIGSVTANAGAFTNLTATGTLTLPDDGISGDDVNGGTISNFASTGIDDNATSTAITIDSSQNVGIGTTSPASKLHVIGNGYFTGASSDTLTNGAHLYLRGDSGGASGEGYIAQINGAYGLDFWGYNSGWQKNITFTKEGNVGIGTASPSVKLHITDTSSNHLRIAYNDSFYWDISRQAADGRLSFTDVVGGETLTLLANGNVGIGTTSPSQPLVVSNGGAQGIEIGHGSTNNETFIQSYNRSTSSFISNYFNASQHRFLCSSTERMRIDSSGNLLVGATSNPDNFRLRVVSNLPPIEAYRQETTAGNGVLVCYSNVGGTRTTRMYVRNDGGIANYQSNNVNLSDPRAKEEIASAGGYLNKLCAIPVMNFKYKNEPDGKLNIGVLTTDVEAVAPELVDKECWEFEGEMLDAVFEGDMKYAMLKAIQEQQAIIEDLQTRLSALEAN